MGKKLIKTKEKINCIHCTLIPKFWQDSPASEEDLKQAIFKYLQEPGRTRSSVPDMLLTLLSEAAGSMDLEAEDHVVRRMFVTEIHNLIKLVTFLDLHFWNINPEFIPEE